MRDTGNEVVSMYDRFFMPFTAKFESSQCMNVLFSDDLF